MSPTPPWAAIPLDVRMRRKGERMTEEGTLSIVRRGTRYQIRYASTNPHDRERLPRACPDEAHLAAVLHQLGTESAAITQVYADVQQGKMAVLLVVISAEQLQAFFHPTQENRARGRQSSSRQPRSQALWVHSREARGEAEKVREEFALLLEEATLLLEEAALVVGESQQLLE
jgi:hypothetical protein